MSEKKQCQYIPLKGGKNAERCKDQYGIHKFKDLPYQFCSKHITTLSRCKPESVKTITSKIQESLQAEPQTEVPKIEEPKAEPKKVAPKKVKIATPPPSPSLSESADEDDSGPPSDLETESNREDPSEEEPVTKRNITVKQKSLLDTIANIKDEDPLAIDSPPKKEKKGSKKDKPKIEEPEDMDPPSDEEDNDAGEEEESSSGKGAGGSLFRSKQFVHYGAIQVLGLAEMLLEHQLQLPVSGTAQDLDSMEEFHSALDEALDEMGADMLESFESPYTRLLSIIFFAGFNRTLQNRSGITSTPPIKVEEVKAETSK